MKSIMVQVNYSIYIDTDIWDENALKVWSDIFTDVEDVSDLALDMVDRLTNGETKLPIGVRVIEHRPVLKGVYDK